MFLITKTIDSLLLSFLVDPLLSQLDQRLVRVLVFQRLQQLVLRSKVSYCNPSLFQNVSGYPKHCAIVLRLHNN